MRHLTLTAILSLALLAAFSSPTLAADTTTPNADQLLRAMSAKLTAAKQFSFHATREIDPALLEGRAVAEKARVEVSVSRPNQLAARSVSNERTLRIVADGSKLTVFNQTMNHYAQVPMRTSLDGLVDRLDTEFGFVPPLADFVVSSPYREIRSQAHTVSYVGREKVGGVLGFGGVECHHLALKGRVADAELWIAAGDQLPRKLVATFHNTKGAQLRIDFSAWDLAAPLSASDFAFSPPAGSQKIEMWTKARMQAASKH